MQKNILWNNLLYYHVIPIILSGIGIFLLKDFLYQVLWSAMGMNAWDTLGVSQSLCKPSN